MALQEKIQKKAFEYIYKKYTFTDGAPFGVIEEQS